MNYPAIYKIGEAYNNNDANTIADIETMLRSYNNKIIIAGSRNFNNYDFMKEKLNKILSNLVHDETLLISGMAKGADILAVKYANEFSYDLAEFPANWRPFGRAMDKSAGHKRNKLMAEYATHLIAFWDGQSSGTKHMIDIAKEKGIITRVIKF